MVKNQSSSSCNPDGALESNNSNNDNRERPSMLHLSSSRRLGLGEATKLQEKEEEEVVLMV